MATGTYKPRMKVFDLGEHSIKFDRVTDSENVDFVVSSPNLLLESSLVVKVERPVLPDAFLGLDEELASPSKSLS